MEIVVAIPVFNDWESVAEVMKTLDAQLGLSTETFRVLLVDDGSVSKCPREFGSTRYANVKGISILRLRKNLGHQKALAVALCHLEQKTACDAVLIMDGDGEDKPEYVLPLVEKMMQHGNTRVVFAERTRRSESIGFRLSYGIYRVLHRVLIGRGIKVGNFSVIPRACLPALTVEPMLWNHYAASVIRARIPMDSIPTRRGVRVSGQSRLNFVGLVIHGLAALACYGEIIGVRMIMAAGVALLFAGISMAVLIGLRLFTTLAIPGWTSLLGLLILIMVIQIGSLVINFTMQILSARNLQPFLPCRDYHWFVASIESLNQAEI